MYAAPHFRKRIAYGRGGWPWKGGAQGDSPVHYGPGLCPVAEQLIGERFVWLYHIAYSSTEDDMRDITAAFRKVMAQRDALATAAPALAAKLGGRDAGRMGLAPKQVKNG
jgi:hypothetical protein